MVTTDNQAFIFLMFSSTNRQSIIEEKKSTLIYFEGKASMKKIMATFPLMFLSPKMVWKIHPLKIDQSEKRNLTFFQ